MYCKNCGTQSDTKFCPNCGAELKPETSPNNAIYGSVPNNQANQIFNNAQVKKHSSISIVALIFSLLGPLSIIGLVLGIVDIVSDKSKLKKHGLSVAAIVISGLFWLLVIIGSIIPDNNNVKSPRESVVTTSNNKEDNLTTAKETTTVEPTDTTEKRLKELNAKEYSEYIDSVVVKFAEDNNLAIVKTDRGSPYLNYYLTPIKIVDGKNIITTVNEAEAKELYEKAKALILDNFTDCYTTKYRYSYIGIFIGNCEKGYKIPLMYFANLQLNVEYYQQGEDESNYWQMDFYYDTFWENKP